MPSRLERVVVAVPKGLYDRAIARIVSEGFFHVDEPPREVKGVTRPGFRQAFNQASERVSRIESYFRSMGLEPGHSEGVELRVSRWIESFNSYMESFRDLEEFYAYRSSRLSAIEGLSQELASALRSLSPVRDLEVDIMEAYDATHLDYSIGFTGNKEIVEELELLAREGLLVCAVEEVEEGVVVSIASKPGAMRAILSRLARYGLELITIPRGLPGSPREAYEALEARLRELGEEASRIRGEMASRAGELRRYYTVAKAYREVFRVISSTVETGTMSVFRGYVDLRDSRRLVEALEEETGGAYQVISEGVVRGGARVPSKIDLPPFIRPFHNIVRLYGQPDPDEVVPTIFLAVTLPLTFAIMFPDAGHGMLLLAVALLYLMPRNRDWGFILAVFGSLSIVTGLMAAELFGPIPAEIVGLPSLWKALGFERPPLALPSYAVEHGEPELVTELVMRAVDISLWMAGFMLTFGSLLGVVDAYLKRDLEGLLTLRLPKLLFFASLTSPFLVLGDAREGGGVLRKALLEGGGGELFPTLVLAGSLLGVLWILAGPPLYSLLLGHGFLGSLGHSVLEAYETVLMATGNIPSFLRIMALALAHSSLMLGFAIIFELLSEGLPLGFLVGAALYVAGNAMVAGLEALLAFAHSVRLHFYEWFSKFYSGTGFEFQPASLPGVKIIVAQ